MRRIDEYAAFSVTHFPQGGQQQDEDCRTFTAAQRRYRDLVATPGMTDVQVYGWLAGTNEPHLLKESDDGTPARKSRRSPPRPPGKQPQPVAAAECDRHQEQHEPALGQPARGVYFRQDEPQPPQTQRSLFDGSEADDKACTAGRCVLEAPIASQGAHDG